jgi:H/ACA ribonucleoprotein complex subunit 4
MEEFEKLLSFSLININKPSGPTSYKVSEFIRRELGIVKTSHMGTLDPRVTGVLPVTLGRACKLADYFIKHDKSYVGILHTHNKQELGELQKLIDENFLGKIKQTPPSRSAVKRAERVREVYSFKFLESSDDKREFLFSCKVEGGTYIRKLCSDLGEMIGGAHMAELRRTEAGIFDEEKIYDLDEFEDAVDKYKSGDFKMLRKMIIPAEIAIKQVLKFVGVEKRAVKSLHNGKPLFFGDVIDKVEISEGERFSVFCGNKFIGVYRRTNEDVIFGRAEFVYN